MSMSECFGNGPISPADVTTGTAGGAQSKRRAMERELQKAFDAYSVLLRDGEGPDGMAEGRRFRISEGSGTGPRADGTTRSRSRITSPGGFESGLVARGSGAPLVVAPESGGETVFGACSEPPRAAGVVGDATEPEAPWGGSLGQYRLRGKRDFSVAIHVADGVAHVLMSAPSEHQALARETLMQQLQKQNWRIGRFRLNGAVIVDGAEEHKIMKTGGYY